MVVRLFAFTQSLQLMLKTNLSNKLVGADNVLTAVFGHRALLSREAKTLFGAGH